MKGIARILLLSGAAGIALAALLPWVTVEGLPIHLDWIGTRISPVGRTVSGMDTPAWPFLLGAAGLVAVLTLLNLARKLLLLFGLLTTVVGAGLAYYVMNVIDIETSGRSALEQTVAGVAIASSAEAGPFVLLGSGLCILLGALRRD